MNDTVSKKVNLYRCYYNEKVTDVKADSTYGAQKQAIAVWRVPRSKQHMVSVMLLSQAGKSYSHSTSVI